MKAKKPKKPETPKYIYVLVGDVWKRVTVVAKATRLLRVAAETLVPGDTFTALPNGRYYLRFGAKWRAGKLR